MPLPFPYSAAASCTGDAPVSDLMAMALQRTDVISLAAGFVDHATLPVEPVRTALETILSDDVEARRSLQYGTTMGDLKLRRRLVDRLVRDGELTEGESEGVQHRLIVTTGSQQVLYLVCEALVDPGDIVLVESPTYFVFLGVLQRFGARVIGIPTDDGGLRIDALEGTLDQLEAEGQLDRVKLIYTIPEHSNPTGLSLAPERRPALVEVAKRYSRRHKIVIVEDAAYRRLTFDGQDPRSVWHYDDTCEHVIHARTFSKTFSPGIKVGYGIFPGGLVEKIHNLKESQDFGTAHFNQQLIEVMLGGDTYDRHVQRIRDSYRKRRDAMLNALERYMAGLEGAVKWTRPGGGLYVWLTVPEGIDMGKDGPIFNRCLDEGVLYVPGALAYPHEPEPPPTNHARLSFGVASEAGIDEAIRRLSIALAECLDPVSP